MKIIDNFNLLSEEEKKQIAEEFITKINEQNLLSNEVDIELVEVLEGDELDGGLNIVFATVDALPFERVGHWQVGDEDELHSTPKIFDVEFDETIYKDAKAAFKTTSLQLDGYNISIDDIDVDDESIDEVEVEDYTHEDSGIGHYEYWGFEGYDSHPYIEVNGTLYCSGSVSGILYIVRAE